MYRLSNENVNNCGNSIYKLNERVEYELKFDMPLTHIFSLTSVCLSHSLPWNDNFVATIFSWNIILIYSSYFFYMTGMTFWDATKFFFKHLNKFLRLLLRNIFNQYCKLLKVAVYKLFLISIQQHIYHKNSLHKDVTWSFSFHNIFFSHERGVSVVGSGWRRKITLSSL